MLPMKPAQDSKPSKRKESTPSSKDAADGDKVLSKSTPPKNDKKSSSEQLQGTNKVVSLSTPLNEDQKPSSEQLQGTNELVASSAPPNKDQKPPSHELLRGGDDIASSDKVVSSPTIQPEKGLNEGKERSTAPLPKVVSSPTTSEKGQESSSVQLRGKDDTSTHTHTASNKDTKGSGEKKALTELLRGDNSIIDKSQPLDNERTGQDK